MNVVSYAQIAFIFQASMRSHNVLILRMFIDWSSQVSMGNLSLSVTVLLVCPGWPPDVSVLSTWLVVCLVPCAPMSIVCPLPSCYLIIVSVAPAVSPSLPSFVSLYSSPCVCSPVLIRCLSCVVRYVSVSCWLCSSFMPACLPACFSPSGWFLFFFVLFYFIIKRNHSLHLSPRPHLSWQTVI